MKTAKQFFSERLKTLSLSGKELVFRKLTQQLLFALYSISHEVDVQVAFETMNNRGKPLSHLELLKNRLIYLSSKFETDVHEKTALRKTINDAWRDIYDYLGRNSNRRLDDDRFLVNHYISYFPDALPKRRSSSHNRWQVTAKVEYSQYLLEKKFLLRNIAVAGQAPGSETISSKDVDEYARSLQHSVIAWHGIENPLQSVFGANDKELLEKINKFSAWSISPLLLVAFQSTDFESSRTSFLRAVERYLFAGAMFSFYHYLGGDDEELLFPPLAHELYTKRISLDAIVKEINARTNRVFELPNAHHTAIVEAFRSRGFYEWGVLRYFLYEYELHLKEKAKTYRDKVDWKTLIADGEQSSDYITVEHILPQRIAKDSDWHVHFKKYSEKQRQILKHSLGNLVPLSRRKNSSLSNLPFAKKVDAGGNIGFRYGGYAENELTRHGSWTAIQILIRGIVLLNFLEQRWQIKIGTLQDKIHMLGLDFVPEKEAFFDASIQCAVKEWTESEDRPSLSKKRSPRAKRS